MYIPVWIIVVIIIIYFLHESYFSASGQMKRLWKRIHKLDNEIYKIFEENPDFDTDKLAFNFENLSVDLYYKIATCSNEIQKAGQLIDAMLNYYSYDEEYILHNGYNFKSLVNTLKRDKLFVETPRPHLSIQEALKIREEEMRRKNNEKSS